MAGQTHDERVLVFEERVVADGADLGGLEGSAGDAVEGFCGYMLTMRALLLL